MQVNQLCNNMSSFTIVTIVNTVIIVTTEYSKLQQYQVMHITCESASYIFVHYYIKLQSYRAL